MSLILFGKIRKTEALLEIQAEVRLLLKIGLFVRRCQAGFSLCQSNFYSHADTHICLLKH